MQCGEENVLFTFSTKKRKAQGKPNKLVVVGNVNYNHYYLDNGSLHSMMLWVILPHGKCYNLTVWTEWTLDSTLIVYANTWWRHQMEPFSALLDICAGNLPVPGEFPAQRTVTRSFDVFFDLRQYKRPSKQSWGWWFETTSRPSWRHCNKINQYDVHDIICCPKVIRKNCEAQKLKLSTISFGTSQNKRWLRMTGINISDIISTAGHYLMTEGFTCLTQPLITKAKCRCPE